MSQIVTRNVTNNIADLYDCKTEEKSLIEIVVLMEQSCLERIQNDMQGFKGLFVFFKYTLQPHSELPFFYGKGFYNRTMPAVLETFISFHA